MLKKSLSIVLVALMIFSVISVGVISASAAYYEPYQVGELFYDVATTDSNWYIDGFEDRIDVSSYSVENTHLIYKGKSSSATIPYTVSFVGHLSTKTYSITPGFDAYTFDGCKNLKNIYVDNKYSNYWNRISLNNWDMFINDDIDYGEYRYYSKDGILMKDVYNSEFYEIQFRRKDDIGDIIVRYPEGKTESTYTIPSDVIDICDGAFNGCDNLKDIYVEQGNDFYTSVDGVLFDKNKETLIALPCGKSNLLTHYDIPEGCKRTAKASFCSNNTISSITVPLSFEMNINTLNEELPNLESVIVIYNPNRSYAWSKSITDVVIPEGTTVINSSAFSGCNGISSVAIPKSVTKIHEGAFSNCTGIEDVYYAGTQDEWNEIKIFDNNKYLTYADIHFESDGEEQEIVKNGWAKEDGKWLYYKDRVAQTGWQKISKKWYYFNSDGVMQTGWQKINKKWYYFDKSGAMLSGWQKISNKWYYFDASGAMLTGWQKISKKWYYFNASGAMLTGWQKISNKWYYFNASGVMTTGWLKLSGKWYYFNSSGAMLANCSQKIGSKTYKFNKSGVCLNP